MRDYRKVRFRVTKNDKLGAQDDEVDVCTLNPDSIVYYEASFETSIKSGYNPCSSLYITILHDSTTQSILDLPSDARKKIYFEVLDGGTYSWYGSFYAESIHLNKEAHEITITAYDYLYFLAQKNFKGTNVKSQSFDQWVNGENLEPYMPDFGALCPKWGAAFVDGSGSASGYLPQTTCRDAMRLVAEASGTVFYYGSRMLDGIRQDEILLFRDVPSDEEDIYTISPDSIVEGTVIKTNENNKTALSVLYRQYSAPDSTIALQEIASGKNILVGAGERLTVDFDLLLFPVDSDPANVKIYVNDIIPSSRISYELYGDHILVTIDNTAGTTSVTTFVNIIGKPLVVNEKAVERGNKESQTTTVIDNPLIDTRSHAAYISLIHTMYDLGSSRVRFEFFDPDAREPELLDNVILEGTSYQDLIIVKKTVRASSSELSIALEGVEYANAYASSLSFAEGGDTNDP